MAEREIAIQIQGVRKRYRLGTIGGTTLREELESWWAKKRGKEDPNISIGIDPRLIGKEFWALDGIDLTVYRGERLGIIGANGAGKSTLLKLLSQITAPTEGTIDIWGRISSMLEIGTGFHGEMTGRENIYMNGAILGLKKTEIDQRMDRIIEFSEIGDFIDTPVKRYSSGMFVKLAFSVAAHLDSEIMVMDEVLAVGDMAFQQKCLDKMREAAETQGRTVLYVSHNMDTIRRLCQRCVVLHQGKIIFDGEVEKAIAVYLNHATQEDPVEIDLAALSGNDLFGLRMVHLSLVGKMQPVYAPGETLNLSLTLAAQQSVDDLRLRLTLQTEKETAIGTAWSQPVSLPASGTHRIDCSLSTDRLAKGTLYAGLGLYRTDETGREWCFCYIPRAFMLRIQGLPVWNTAAHGYVKLPEMTARVHSGTDGGSEAAAPVEPETAGADHG